MESSNAMATIGWTRGKCAILGAAVFELFLMIFSGISVAVEPLHFPSLFRFTYVASGPVLLLGMLSAIIRYQMFKGTSQERAGEGGCLNVIFILCVGAPLGPVLMCCAPIFLIDSIFKTNLWNNMNSRFLVGYATVFTALIVARMSKLHDGNVFTVAVVGAIGAGDLLMHWTMHRLNDSSRLAEPGNPGVHARFSLRTMMIVVMVVAAYATGLVLMFRESKAPTFTPEAWQ